MVASPSVSASSPALLSPSSSTMSSSSSRRPRSAPPASSTVFPFGGGGGGGGKQKSRRRRFRNFKGEEEGDGAAGADSSCGSGESAGPGPLGPVGSASGSGSIGGAEKAGAEADGDVGHEITSPADPACGYGDPGSGGEGPGPNTYDDDGRPGEGARSAAVDLRRVLELIQDERHLVAYNLYKDAKERVERYEADHSELLARLAAATALDRKEGEDDDDDDARTVMSHPLRSMAHGIANLRSRHHLHGHEASEEETEDGKPKEEEDDDEMSVKSTPMLKSFAHGLATFRSRRHVQLSKEEETIAALTAAQREDLRGYREAREMLTTRGEEYDRLEKRSLLFHRAQRNLTVSTDWIKAQTLFGVTTYYRREPDRSLSVKLEGELIGVPLFEQLAVLRETDLYSEWAPFCSSSRKLAQLGRIDVVSWFMTGLPLFGLSRDACFRAVGCDCMREDGSILIVGEGLGDRKEDGVKSSAELNDEARAGGGKGGRRKSSVSKDAERRRPRAASVHETALGGSAGATLNNGVRSESAPLDSYHDEGDGSASASAARFYEAQQSEGSYLTRDAILSTIEIPPVPSKIGSGRMTIRSFQGVIDVLSPSSARTRIVSNIDPNIRFLPNALVDFCMKKLCGVLLNKLQSAARKVVDDPAKSPHARRMREDSRFYRHWLLPKFAAHCEERGWEMPPVAAFSVPEGELDEEEWLLYGRTRDGGALRQSMSTGDLREEAGPDGGGGAGRRDAAAMATEATALAATLSSSRSPLSAASAPAARRRPSPRDDDGSSASDSASATVSTLSAPPQNVPGVSDLVDRLREPRNMLVAPRIVAQHVSLRQERKKAADVAEARQRAAERLKPRPLDDDKRRRVRELKEAKRRFRNREAGLLEPAHRSGGPVACDAASVTRGAVPRDAACAKETGGAVPECAPSPSPSISPAERLIRLLSGGDPALPGTRTLPFLVLCMFVLFNLDASPLCEIVESMRGPTSSSTTTFGRAAAALLRFVLRESLFLAFVALCSLLFWSVLTTSSMVAFDSIQMPGGVDYSKLEYGKRIYATSVRWYVSFLTVAIAGTSLAKAMALGIWRDVVVRWYQWAVRLVIETFVQGKEGLEELWSKLFFATKVSGIVVESGKTVWNCVVFVGGAICDYFGRTLLALAGWLNGLFCQLPLWRIPMASFVVDSVMSIFRGAFGAVSAARTVVAARWASAFDSSSAAPAVVSWRSDALTTATSVMSYVVVFALSVLLVAGVLLPKTKKSVATATAATEDRGGAVESDAKSDGSVSQQSGSYFSFASGEAPPPPPSNQSRYFSSEAGSRDPSSGASSASEAAERSRGGSSSGDRGHHRPSLAPAASAPAAAFRSRRIFRGGGGGRGGGGNNNKKRVLSPARVRSPLRARSARDNDGGGAEGAGGDDAKDYGKGDDDDDVGELRRIASGEDTIFEEENGDDDDTEEKRETVSALGGGPKMMRGEGAAGRGAEGSAANSSDVERSPGAPPVSTDADPKRTATAPPQKKRFKRLKKMKKKLSRRS